MNYDLFLDRVIDDGIAAAREDYAKPVHIHKLEGAVEGFEACRRQRPDALRRLHLHAREKTRSLADEGAEPAIYWRHRCYAAEIEWVCNVVSAALVNIGEAPILAPSARATLKAAEVLRDGQVEA